MSNRIFIALIILVVVCACGPSAVAYDDTSSVPEVENSPAQSEQESQGSPAQQEQDSQNSPSSSVSGLHFSGQGPSTWSINKEPGMAIMHVKVTGCPDFTLSGKGKNIPGSPDDFQAYPVWTHYEEWESSFVLDNPTIWRDYFDSPPQTEMLRVDVDQSANCYWELTILPMSAAQTISPGDTISGSYDDVIRVSNSLSGIYLNLDSSDKKILQNFRAMYAILNDGSEVCLHCQPDGDSFQFDNLPAGTEYLYFYSVGYWELVGQ